MDKRPVASPIDEYIIMVYDYYSGKELFRVSVGLEDADDLIEDLAQALR